MKMAVFLSLLGLILLSMMQIQASSNTNIVSLKAETEYFTTSIFDAELNIAKKATTVSQSEYFASPFELAR